MEEHSFQVRSSDENMVLLCAHDQDPSNKLLHETRKKVCMGVALHLVQMTDVRDDLVQLMDDGDIGPCVKIICVYTRSMSVSGAKWVRHDGCGCTAYPSKALICVVE